MPHVGEWIVRRRKALGLETQMDLARESTLSLKTISDLESKGDLTSRERSTKKLLAEALDVALNDLERLGRGEIADAPRTTRARVELSITNVADGIEWFTKQNRDAQLDVLAKIDPTVAMRAAQLLMERAASGIGRRLTVDETLDVQEAIRKERAKLEARKKAQAAPPTAPAAGGSNGQAREQSLPKKKGA